MLTGNNLIWKSWQTTDKGKIPSAAIYACQQSVAMET